MVHRSHRIPVGLELGDVEVQRPQSVGRFLSDHPSYVVAVERDAAAPRNDRKQPPETQGISQKPMICRLPPLLCELNQGSPVRP